MPSHAATPCRKPLCTCPILQNSLKNGEAVFYDTVSKTWKTRYYANRADLQAGPAAVGGGMAQGVSPLVRAPTKGLNILVR